MIKFGRSSRRHSSQSRLSFRTTFGCDRAFNVGGGLFNTLLEQSTRSPQSCSARPASVIIEHRSMTPSRAGTAYDPGRWTLSTSSRWPCSVRQAKGCAQDRRGSTTSRDRRLAVVFFHWPNSQRRRVQSDDPENRTNHKPRSLDRPPKPSPD